MGSFTSKEIVDDIIAHNGEGTDGPFTYVKLVEYKTPEGETCWGGVVDVEVIQGMGNRYDVETQYIRSPKIIWTRKEPTRYWSPEWDLT